MDVKNIEIFGDNFPLLSTIVDASHPVGSSYVQYPGFKDRYRTDRHKREHSEVGRRWYKDTEAQIHPVRASLGTRGRCACTCV